MKRIACFLALVAILATVAFSLATLAQIVPRNGNTTSTVLHKYVVQKGDTLWVMEGAFTGRPYQWGRLLDLNPFLKSPGRIWTDKKGRTIVLIRPGEALLGLVELGIIPKALPLEEPKAVPAPAREDSPVVGKVTYSYHLTWFGWLLLLLLLILVAVGVTWMIRQIMIRKNPVTFGPPVVPGGVTDATAANQFVQNITRESGMPVQDIEVRGLVRGRGYGLMTVAYRDGSRHRMILTGQTVYLGLVRRGNHVADEYMLQGCGNDLIISRLMYIPGFLFRFVRETVIDLPTRPTPPPVRPVPPTGTKTVPPPKPPIVPKPDPAPVQPPVPPPTTAPTPDGRRYFTFKPSGQRGLPYLVEFKGFDYFEVEVKDGWTTVRFN